MYDKGLLESLMIKEALMFIIGKDNSYHYGALTRCSTFYIYHFCFHNGSLHR